MAFELATSAPSKYVLTVDTFKGVDLAGNPTAKNPARADWAKNLITDGNGYPETRHGYSQVLGLTERINGIYKLMVSGGARLLIHHGEKLSEWDGGETLTEVYAAMNNAKSTACQLDDKLLILDGKAAVVYGYWEDEDEPDWGAYPLTEKAYAPTVLIGATYGGTPGGTVYENLNLVSDYQYNQFCITEAVSSTSGSGGSYNSECYLQLSDAPISDLPEDISVWKLNSYGDWELMEYGASVSDAGYRFDSETGRVLFAYPDIASSGSAYYGPGLAKTPITGHDNYRVKFKSKHSYNEAVSDKYDHPATDIMYWCFPEDQASSTEGEWLAARPEGYWGIMVTHYSFPLKGEDIDLEAPIYLYIDSCNASATINKEIKGRYLLSGDFTDFGSFEDGDKIYYADDGSYTAIWYKLVTDADGGAVLELLAFGGLVSWGGGSYFAQYGDAPDIFYTGKISYQTVLSSYPSRINYCTIAQKYGYGGNFDRIFLAGNDILPNYDFWSEYNNPLYFPDQNYAVCGSEATAITAFSWLSDGALAVHKEPSETEPCWFYHTGTTVDDKISFTLTQGAIGLGAISGRAGAYVNNEPLQLAPSGVFATAPVANTAINEYYAQNRSYFINPLLKKQDLQSAEACLFDGKYYLAAGDYVFVADTEQKAYAAKGDDISYEWYIWDNVPVWIWWVHDNRLYFADGEGNLFGFDEGYTDNGAPIKWEWLTPWLDFDRQTYYKKIKNVILLTAGRLWQEPKIEYRFPKKTGREKALSQTEELQSPFLTATNYKARKVSLMQLRIFGEGQCGLAALNVLYTVGGKFKG